MYQFDVTELRSERESKEIEIHKMLHDEITACIRDEP